MMDMHFDGRKMKDWNLQDWKMTDLFMRHPKSRATKKLHCVSKKRPTLKLSVTLSNLNRFSKFLHYLKAYKIRYKTNTTLPTSP